MEETPSTFLPVLNTYFPILLAALLTYFFTRRQDSAAKIKENKIESIKDFLKSYHALYLANLSFFHQAEFGEHAKEKFDERFETIRQARIEFALQLMIIKLFLKKDDQLLVDELSDKLETCRTSVANWSRRRLNNVEIPDETEKKYEAVNDCLNKELPSKIEQLASNLRVDFGIDLHPFWKQTYSLTVQIIIASFQLILMAAFVLGVRYIILKIIG